MFLLELINVFFQFQNKVDINAFVWYRRLGGQGASKIRARGNVHTLHSGDNDNDENNTWNGNSTQQM